MGIAIGGALLRRNLQRRRHLKAETSAPHSNQQTLESGQFNDHIIPEEPEDNLESDRPTDPWYLPPWRRIQAICSVGQWKKWLLKPSTIQEPTQPDSNGEEGGKNARKLQKKRGILLNDTTDLPVRIMPPASAVSRHRPISGHLHNTTSGNGDDHSQKQGEQSRRAEGSTTAIRTTSDAAATHRRSHSSSV